MAGVTQRFYIFNILKAPIHCKVKSKELRVKKGQQTILLEKIKIINYSNLITKQKSQNRHTSTYNPPFTNIVHIMQKRKVITQIGASSKLFNLKVL